MPRGQLHLPGMVLLLKTPGRRVCIRMLCCSPLCPCAAPTLQATWTSVRFPQKGTVYDYHVNFKTSKFAPWSVAPLCRVQIMRLGTGSGNRQELCPLAPKCF